MSSVNSTSSVAMYETLSKRGNEELDIQNYKFSFHKKLAGRGSRWKCVNQKYCAYLRMFDCGIRVKNAIKINFITVVTNYLHY